MDIILHVSTNSSWLRNINYLYSNKNSPLILRIFNVLLKGDFKRVTEMMNFSCDESTTRIQNVEFNSSLTHSFNFVIINFFFFIKKINYFKKIIIKLLLRSF